MYLSQLFPETPVLFKLSMAHSGMHFCKRLCFLYITRSQLIIRYYRVLPVDFDEFEIFPPALYAHYDK